MKIIQDIIPPKRNFFKTLDRAEDRLDHMLESRWTLGTWFVVFFGSMIGVMLMIVLGNIVLGLD